MHTFLIDTALLLGGAIGGFVGGVVVMKLGLLNKTISTTEATVSTVATDVANATKS